MKISFNWLKAYIDTEASAAEIGALLTGSGLEVEDIADYYSIPGGLEGIVIGEVISAIPHPNADKLRISQVNLGDTQKTNCVWRTQCCGRTKGIGCYRWCYCLP